MSSSLQALRLPAPSERFSLDSHHAMEARDNALIADEVLHGPTSNLFAYSFTNEAGETSTGISVVGARHLVSHYGGIKHRLVSTITKRGSRCTIIAQAHGDTPPAVNVSTIEGWDREPDWCAVTVEVQDVKKGNVLQITHEEAAVSSAGVPVPLFEKIAASKAYRNAVLALLPQDVIADFKARALAQGNTDGADPLQERRATVIGFAAAHAIRINRGAVQALAYAQIDGLAAAARDGGTARFHAALAALGALAGEDAPTPPPGSGIDRPARGPTPRGMAPAPVPVKAAPAESLPPEPPEPQVDQVAPAGLKPAGAELAPPLTLAEQASDPTPSLHIQPVRVVGDQDAELQQDLPLAPAAPAPRPDSAPAPAPVQPAKAIQVPTRAGRPGATPRPPSVNGAVAFGMME